MLSNTLNAINCPLSTVIHVPIHSVLPPNAAHFGGIRLVVVGDPFVWKVPAGLVAYPTVLTGDYPLLFYPLFGSINSSDALSMFLSCLKTKFPLDTNRNG